MRRFLKHLGIMLGVLFVALELVSLAAIYYPSPSDLPPLKDGDLVFQSTLSSQSTAILVATGSVYTHMGIVAHRGEELVVIEAGRKVQEMPLMQWVRRGVFKRVTVYRDNALKPGQAATVLIAARALIGQPYDIFFAFDNGKVYCSELPYLAFKKAGIPLGKVEKLSELRIHNAPVQKLIQQRWRRHPVCKERQYDYTECYNYLMEQELVSPASIAADDKLTEIYSNYP